MIGIPSHDGRISTNTASQLMGLAYRLNHFGASAGIIKLDGSSLIDKARNTIVRTFLNMDPKQATDLLFLDSDIEFEDKRLVELIAKSQVTEADILCGLYLTKSPKDPVFKATPYRDEDGNMIREKGLVRMKRAPTGFMLIRRHVLEKLYELHWDERYEDKGEQVVPVFKTHIKDGQYMGEDFAFCDLVRDAGFKIYADPNTTLWHVGTFRWESNFQAQIVIPELNGEDVRRDAK